VRNRLLVSVVLCSLAVAAAGAPGILDASGRLTDAQRQVERAELNVSAVGLAHSLADERDDMVEHAAAGGSGDGADGGVTPPGGTSQRARVDRQVTEILATGALPAPAARSLRELPQIRRLALRGDSTAQETYEAYGQPLRQLQGVSAGVARGVTGAADPDDAEADALATAEALPHLGRAVEHASATRGLLRGALAAGGLQRQLTTSAQQAHVREQGALADFEETVGATARETFDKTVTGTDVGIAERHLTRLTDRPYLGADDRALDREEVASALSARIDRMRGVHSSLATAELTRLGEARDDAVTALELRVALVGAFLLLAVGASVSTARSLARPLSVLRRGSQRLAAAPEQEEPVRFTGRNDEFADVVRALNALRGTAAALHARATEAEADKAHLARARDELAAEREQLAAECAALRERVDDLPGAGRGTFLHLALRTLGLVERQLGVLESLEAEESDPERLATLFTLDHLATRMRRHSENLLLMAGGEHATGPHAAPVPLLDVLRAAVSEIERYERVTLQTLPPHTRVSGFAAADLSHLVAELLDNATAFSAPDAEVQLSGWLLAGGELMLSVQDEGIGVTEERLAELNARMEPGARESAADDDELGLGLSVVANLAARHGLRVQLRRQKQGGTAAVVFVPRGLLPDRPSPVFPPTGRTTAATGTAVVLPGSEAEANSHALPSRRGARQAPPARVPAQEAPDAAAPDAADGPISTDRTATGADAPGGEAPAAGEDDGAGTLPGTQQVLTDKGLPKRTPRTVAASPSAPAPGRGSANAEELRRRLGGFQRGSLKGQRDAEAEAREGAGRAAKEEEARQ
jgi:signal transduction histidine kinase